ncbi:hypothetical protein D3C85_867800 [compost metagenome]
MNDIVPQRILFHFSVTAGPVFVHPNFQCGLINIRIHQCDFIAAIGFKIFFCIKRWRAFIIEEYLRHLTTGDIPDDDRGALHWNRCHQRFSIIVHIDLGLRRYALRDRAIGHCIYLGLAGLIMDSGSISYIKRDIWHAGYEFIIETNQSRLVNTH